MDDSKKTPVEVSAALIRDGKGRFLICRRPENKARGLLWEFVGGKREAGETGEEALVRECREELDAGVTVGDVFMDVTHVYPDLTIHLTLYNAVLSDGAPRMLEHVGMMWIRPDEIGRFAFCPADETILERIREKF